MADRWEVLTLQVKNLHLQILPGIGGRLWDVKFHGRSLLFQNPDLIGLPVDDANLTALPTRSPQFKFPLWGGEKTWIAPDHLWPDGAPYTVLDSTPFQVTSHSATHIELASQVCPISHLSIKRRIHVVSAQQWTIRHEVQNHGSHARPCGIWSVMMIDTPATIGVNMQDPDVQLVFGAVGNSVVELEGGVIARCLEPQEYKISMANPDGKSLIKFGLNGPWLECSVPHPQPGMAYAHKFPFEIFNSKDYPYCEAEWHSPIALLQPNEILTYEQDFQLWADDAAFLGTEHEEMITCMS